MWNSEIIMIRNNYEKLYLKICYTYIFIYMYVPQIMVEKVSKIKSLAILQQLICRAMRSRRCVFRS